jgi:hypothetical protein
MIPGQRRQPASFRMPRQFEGEGFVIRDKTKNRGQLTRRNALSSPASNRVPPPASRVLEWRSAKHDVGMLGVAASGKTPDLPIKWPICILSRKSRGPTVTAKISIQRLQHLPSQTEPMGLADVSRQDGSRVGRTCGPTGHTSRRLQEFPAFGCPTKFRILHIENRLPRIFSASGQVSV